MASPLEKKLRTWKRRRSDDKLFRELVAAHKLGSRQRKLLVALADRYRLTRLSEIFVRPSLMTVSPDRSIWSNAEVQKLRSKLVPPRPATPATTTVSETPTEQPAAAGVSGASKPSPEAPPAPEPSVAPLPEPQPQNSVPTAGDPELSQEAEDEVHARVDRLPLVDRSSAVPARAHAGRRPASPPSEPERSARTASEPVAMESGTTETGLEDRPDPATAADVAPDLSTADLVARLVQRESGAPAKTELAPQLDPAPRPAPALVRDTFDDPEIEGIVPVSRE